MRGVPGVFLHSLIGSRNYKQGVEITGKKRTINREKLDLKELEKVLSNHFSLRYQVYKKYTNLLKIRKRESAFHPNAEQNILFLDENIFALLRISQDRREKIIVLCNVCNKKKYININLEDIKLDTDNIYDLISNEEFKPKKSILKIKLNPYQVMWLKINK